MSRAKVSNLLVTTAICGHLDAALVQFGQHFAGMGKRCRPDRAVLPVVGQHLFVKLAKLFAGKAALFVDCLGKHRFRTADQRFGMIDRDQVETPQRQRMIDRFGQIAVRVEEGAVEVEANHVEGEIGHRISPMRFPASIRKRTVARRAP